MDDFSALAQRVALGVGDVPGCLILSRDGLVLGSYPDDDNTRVKQAWLRFALLGAAERGFIELADQVWVYAHRGPYAAFAVGDISVRPGLLLDMLEQALLEAEESRTKREGLRPREGGQAPSGRLRSTMHPTLDRPQLIVEPVPSLAPATIAQTETADAGAGAPAGEVTVGPEAPAAEVNAGPEEAPKEQTPAPDPDTAPAPDPPETVPPKRKGPPEDEGEVDRVMLAQEFSGLLQAADSDDEG
jgi:hypothetical protein